MNFTHSHDSFFESIAKSTNNDFLASELREIAFAKGMKQPTVFSHNLHNPEDYFPVLRHLRKQGQWLSQMESLALALIFKSTGLKVVVFKEYLSPLRHDGEVEITDGHIVIVEEYKTGVRVYYPTVLSGMKCLWSKRCHMYMCS